MRRLRDWRVWLGLAITGVALWLALRGVSFREVARDVRQADLGLLFAVAIPSQILALWVRAIRWRHLTDPVQPIGGGALFRAVAVGFMANNLFPLRIGEVVRAWYLSRETGASGSALLGTVVLERVIDSMFFVGMAAALLGIYGARLPGGLAVALLIPVMSVSVAPLLIVLWLRLAPDSLVRFIDLVGRPLFRDRVTDWVLRLLRSFAEGLGSLRGGMHLFWIAWHSILIWMVFATLPFYVGFVALDIDFGSPARGVAAAYATLVAVGLAIAVPSAPGFFGTYHWACREVLTSGFGVPESQAVALGTLVHASFWVSVTALGLGVLWLRHTSLEEIGEVAEGGVEPGKAPFPESR